MDERDEVFITFDGQAGFQLQAGDEITVGARPGRCALHPPVDAQLLRGAADEAEMGRALGTTAACLLPQALKYCT